MIEKSFGTLSRICESGLLLKHVASGSGIVHLPITEALFGATRESSSASLIAICFTKALSSSWPGCSRKESSAGDSLILFKDQRTFSILLACSHSLKVSLPGSISKINLQISSNLARIAWGQPSRGFPRSEQKSSSSTFDG